MAVDVRQNTSRALRLVPPDGAVWSSPACSIKDADGDELATPAVTVDSVSTTLATTGSTWQWVLTSATGVAVGRHYQVVHDGVTYVVQVTELDSTTIEVEPALPESPDVGSTFKGIELALTIPTDATEDRGHHLEVVCTDADDDSREARDVFHVVRRPFIATPSWELRRLLQAKWPSFEMSEVELEDLAGDVEEEIREELLGLGRYADWYVDPRAFRPLSSAIARRQLAVEHGLVPPGAGEVDEYVARLNKEIGRKLGRLVQSYQPADADDDGSTDDDSESDLAVRLSL